MPQLPKPQLAYAIDSFIQMYVPSGYCRSNLSQKLRISKVTSPKKLNISFQSLSNASNVLHGQLDNAINKQKNQNRIVNRTIHRDKANKKIKEWRIKFDGNPACQQINRESDIRWKSVDLKQQSCFRDHTKKQVRLSISRMIQQSTDKQSFNYIKQFYKKPIENQIITKKNKKVYKNICHLLRVSQYKPNQQLSNRYIKTASPLCKCHKKQENIDFKRLSYTSYLTRRQRVQILNKQVEKPKTSSLRNRRVIDVNVPDNWTICSWNTQIKNEASLGIFHQ